MWWCQCVCASNIQQINTIPRKKQETKPTFFFFYRRWILGKLPRLAGSSLSKLLFERCKISSLWRLPSSVGIIPSKLWLDILSSINSVRRPRVEGSVPVKPDPLSADSSLFFFFFRFFFPKVWKKKKNSSKCLVIFVGRLFF